MPKRQVLGKRKPLPATVAKESESEEELQLPQIQLDEASESSESEQEDVGEESDGNVEELDETDSEEGNSDDDDDKYDEFAESDVDSEESEEGTLKLSRTTTEEEKPWWESNPPIEPVYNSDTSDEEGGNTIGNVPIEWYKDFPHIGYTVDGKKIYKPAQGDALDDFLAKMDDPKFWKSIPDKYTGENVELTKEELEIIKRLQQGDYGDSSYDPYPDYIPYFSSQVEPMPLSAAPEPKSRFIPSKWESQRIMKIVRAIRKGLIVPKKPRPERPRVYMLWDENDQERQEHVMHVPAPKVALPEHDESYNPPEEYLPTEEEAKEWLAMEPEDRERNFLPHKYPNLRTVEAYDRFINERFERCLDLYLCPRVRKNKIQMDPEQLLPKLPDPKDLQPFPSRQTIVYKGHQGRVRCLSVDPKGTWLATGGDDKTVKIWHVQTGKCVETIEAEDVVTCIAWNPNKNLNIVAYAVGNIVRFIVPDVVMDAETQETTMTSFVDQSSEAADACAKLHVSWKKGKDVKTVITTPKKVTCLVWHRKGDYFSTISADTSSSIVLIHQMSKRRSQAPFKSNKGLVQRVLFHPTKPHFFVATQRYVRVYDLMTQQLLKKLQSGVKWISTLDVHPTGDNLVIGSYDKRVCWFDMDLSTKPYRVLRSHEKAVRGVSVSKKYPLFASVGDDGRIQVFHGMVYNDMMQNPLIVPLTIIDAHQVKDQLGVLSVEWHPSQPWLFTSGADGDVKLFS